MPFDALKRLILDCARLKVKTIILKGGEIVLYPRLEETLKLIKQLRLKSIVYSHLAYPHTQLKTVSLAEAINVNLSASSAKSYMAIHGDKNFGLVIKNIRLLKRLAHPPEITFTFIITEKNYQEISSYLALAAKLRVNRVNFVLHIATEELKALVISQSAKENLQKSIPRIIKSAFSLKHNLSYILELINAPGFGKNCLSLPWGIDHNDRYFYYKTFPGNRIKCFVAWFYSYIDEQGRVIAPCCNIGVCVAGNILEQSFRQIWLRSKKLKEIRTESMKKVDITEKRWCECRNCGYTDFNRMVASNLNAAPHNSRHIAIRGGATG